MTLTSPFPPTLEAAGNSASVVTGAGCFSHTFDDCRRRFPHGHGAAQSVVNPFSHGELNV